GGDRRSAVSAPAAAIRTRCRRKRAAGETPRGPCCHRRSAKVQAEAEGRRRVVAGSAVAVGVAAAVMVAVLTPVMRPPFARPPAVIVLIAAMIVLTKPWALAGAAAMPPMAATKASARTDLRRIERKFSGLMMPSFQGRCP